MTSIWRISPRIRTGKKLFPDLLPAGSLRAGGTPRPAEKLGFCRHRVFGRGKIVEALPPDKYRVNFPGFGLKVILAAYLSMEE